MPMSLSSPSLDHTHCQAGEITFYSWHSAGIYVILILISQLRKFDCMAPAVSYAISIDHLKFTCMRQIFLLTLGICLIGDLHAQVMVIPDVPDLQQPIDPWWGNLPDNACAPVSAANICVYWDDSIRHSNAVGLNSGVPADSVPSFLYYFMGTNGLGDPTRANPAVYGITPGTITMDIDTSFREYVRWDTSNLFYTPKPFSIPVSKRGFDWKYDKDEVIGFHFHLNEIELLRPDLVVFKYWNPDTTGLAMANVMGGDSIHFFLWGPPVSNTGFPHPHEDWYFDEKANSVGHAVTGVGYLMGWDPDEGGPIPMMDWIVCHDNWVTTPVNVAIPWVDSLWIATFTADPGLDTIHPTISCRDTTVYLDSTGQFHLDVSMIVDSTWDNNGVEQLFLDEYYVTCLNTAVPKTVSATAMDQFGNMAQCTASVTVLDTLPPVLECTDTTVYLDASGTFTIDTGFILTGMSDNCELSNAVLSRTVFDTADAGTLQPVSLIVYDGSGNSGSCQVTITVLDTLAVGVDAEKTLDQKFLFHISPNPSDGHFQIAGLSDSRDCTFEIYNLTGTLLLKKSLPEGNTTLDISNFSKGVYVLKIRDQKGREYRDRIIIR
jgi:hypothetical protein